MFNTLLYQPLLKTLTFLTNFFGGNFGLAIVVFTILIRVVLTPLSLPALRSAQKMRDLKPHLDELKRRYATDRRRLQQEQLDLFKKHGVNPAVGCLPTLVQFAVLIALYQVFIDFIQKGNGMLPAINMDFLWFNLSQSDPFFILPFLAGISQLVLSLMLMPAQEHHAPDELKKSVREKEEKQGLTGARPSGEQTQGMAEAMQQQMLYIMPVMTGLIALRLPSGLAVYWIVTTVFSLIQQYFTTGLGGLAKIALIRRS